MTDERPFGSVVDLFCGAGGLSFGFGQEGFAIMAGVDVDEHCRYPYTANVAAPFLRRDVASLSADELAELFLPGLPRVLVGCAPCQPFSTYNQKNADPGWQLLEEFAKLIVATRPDVVSMENVPRLMHFRGGEVFDKFVTALQEAGYEVAFRCPEGPGLRTRADPLSLGSAGRAWRSPCPAGPDPRRVPPDGPRRDRRPPSY